MKSTIILKDTIKMCVMNGKTIDKVIALSFVIIQVLLSGCESGYEQTGVQSTELSKNGESGHYTTVRTKIGDSIIQAVEMYDTVRHGRTLIKNDNSDFSIKYYFVDDSFFSVEIRSDTQWVDLNGLAVGFSSDQIVKVGTNCELVFMPVKIPGYDGSIEVCSYPANDSLVQTCEKKDTEEFQFIVERTFDEPGAYLINYTASYSHKSLQHSKKFDYLFLINAIE